MSSVGTGLLKKISDIHSVRVFGVLNNFHDVPQHCKNFRLRQIYFAHNEDEYPIFDQTPEADAVSLTTEAIDDTHHTFTGFLTSCQSFILFSPSPPINVLNPYLQSLTLS